MSDETEVANLESRSAKHNSSNFYVIVFGGFMLAGLLCLAWIGRPPRPKMIGQPLPQLDLQPLVDVADEIDNQDIGGKVAVLHFWGTWCPPCQREFPEFAELVEQFHENSDVAIISVSCSGGPEFDLPALEEKTRLFLSDYATKIPTYSDSAAMTRQQIAMLSPDGSFGYPTTLIVDRDGKIAAALNGYREGEMEKLVAVIKSLL